MIGDRRRRLAPGLIGLATLLGACDGARLGQPRMLWALWAVPVLAALLVWSQRSRMARLRRFASGAMLERLTGGASRRRGVGRALLLLSAVTALLLALAQLQVGYTWEDVERRGVDIVVALDVSDSMRVEDAGRALSRLERAKREIHDLLGLLTGDRIAIVAFAGTAFVQCPMTLDYGAAELFLDALDTDAIPIQGTDVAGALELSLQTFKGSAAKSRAVLLITDGEDHSGRALEVAERLAGEDVRVFAIGIGSADGAPIPAQGGGFRRDRRGDIILSRLDEPTLQHIALATSGRYVRSVTGDMDLEQIYLEGIKATLEEREIQSQRRQRWEDRFQWLLAVAIGALMLESVVPPPGGTRRRRRPGRAVVGAERGGRAGRGAVAAAVTLALVAGGGERVRAQDQAAAAAQPRAEAPAAAAPQPAPNRYRTPEEAYRAGDYAQALGGFVELQVERPDDPAVTMNVGSAHYRLNDLEAAQRSFEAAGAAGTERLRAQAWYDLGNVALRQGRLEEAIDHYHRSLDLAPGDVDAKFNLELARVELERQEQQQQQQQQQQDQQQSEDQEQQGSGSGEREQEGREPQQGGSEGDQEQQSEQNGEEQGQQQPGGEQERPGEQGDAQRAAARQGEGDEQPGMSAAEVTRLLDALEEGRPRRKPPKGPRRDQEKDW